MTASVNLTTTIPDADFSARQVFKAKPKSATCEANKPIKNSHAVLDYGGELPARHEEKAGTVFFIHHPADQGGSCSILWCRRDIMCIFIHISQVVPLFVSFLSACTCCLFQFSEDHRRFVLLARACVWWMRLWFVACHISLWICPFGHCSPGQ